MLLWCQTLLYYYISVRSHDRYNSFFSAFHSKQINIKIYSYLNVFDNNNSAPSLHEQLPAIVTRSGFGWMFSHTSTGSLQAKTIQIYRY